MNNNKIFDTHWECKFGKATEIQHVSLPSSINKNNNTVSYGSVNICKAYRRRSIK